MNIRELEKLLSERRDNFHYSLTGGTPSETHCIELREDGNWQTFYSERGHRNCLKVFSSEQEACEYFYNWVKKT